MALLRFLSIYLTVGKRIPGLPHVVDAFLIAFAVCCDRRLMARLTALEQAVRSWPGVRRSAHRYGGTQFDLGTQEIGHFHGNGIVDILFPRSLRDEIVQEGQAVPHHTFPTSGWVSVVLRSPDDVTRAVRLLRRSYEDIQGRAGYNKAAATQGANET